MSMDPHKLVSLLNQIQDDNESALVELYDQYVNVVFSVSYQVLENKQDAEEVTQDVFLRIWNKSALYNPDKGRFVNWLLTMTRRIAIDYLRRKQRVTQVHNPISLDEQDYLWETALIYQDLSELQRMLVSALQELPADYRDVIQLAYFRGMTHTEISQYLNKPLGTIKSHIRQGMEKLRLVWISSEQPN
jgi:RNA polymerase sigma-70 factor, ECF subfamily